MHCFPFPSQDCHVLLLWLIRTPQFPMVSQRKWFTNKCCLLNLLYQKTCTCATWFDMFAKQYVISYVVIYIYLSTQRYSKCFAKLYLKKNAVPMATCASTGFTKKLSFSALCGGISVSSWRVSLRSCAYLIFICAYD